MAEARRLRQLVEFERAIASELSYELLFKRAVEAAASLGQARYAAIGLLDPSGTGHERIVVDPRGRTQGDAETERAAAVLALVAKGGAPLRLGDVASEGDVAGLSPAPRAVSALLGVPIARRDVPYGHLCVADRDGGGPFTGEDEKLIVLLAAQVAVAIENARLYEAASSHARLLESLDEIVVHLAEGDDVSRVLEIVTERLRDLLVAEGVTAWLPDEVGALRLAAVAGDWPADLRGMQAPASSKVVRVWKRGTSARVDSALDDPELDQQFARRLSMRNGLWAPMTIGDRNVGMIVAHNKADPALAFSDGDLRVAEAVARRAALAAVLEERLRGRLEALADEHAASG